MIDITMDEILEDLCYPGPPPGQWRLPPDEDGDTDHLAVLVRVGDDHVG